MGSKSIAVIGTGVIGASWTALFLAKGHRVLASDPAAGAAARLQLSVRSFLDSLKMDRARSDALIAENMFFKDDIKSSLPQVDFVQESGPEKIDYKASVMALLDGNTRRDVIIASSSSGLPASQFIQDCVVNPSRVLIGHPFNPVNGSDLNRPHLIPLVEVVPHSGTAPQVVDDAMRFYRQLGKSPIHIKTETPGFVANRLQAALVHEAYSLVSRGVISAANADLCLSEGLALRWAIQGPFLTKVLGGGGGTEGFANHLKHVGAAASVWQDDMLAHRFSPSTENNQKLIESVREELALLGPIDHEKARDSFISELLKLKSAMKLETRQEN